MPRREEDIPPDAHPTDVRLGYLRMNGREVYKFAVKKFKEVIEDKREERTAEEIAQELNERLASYLQKDPETDPELDGNDDSDTAVH